jgi:hypothetical protein
MALPPFAAATHDDGGRGAAPLGGATVPHQPDLVVLEAEDFATHDRGALVPNATATGGVAWELPTYGGMDAGFDAPTTGTVWFRLYAGGWHEEGARNPHLHLYVDGLQRAEADVRGGWGPYLRAVPLLAGHHALRVESYDNARDVGADPNATRVLLFDRVVIEQPTLEGAPRVAPGAEVRVPAREVHTVLTGALRPDFTAATGSSWWQWGVGCLGETWVAGADGDVQATARVRGVLVAGEGTHVVVKEDRRPVDGWFVGDNWTAHAFTLSAVPAGPHVLEVCYDNDRPGEKRSLWLDEIVLKGATPAAPGNSTPDAPTREVPAIVPPPASTTPPLDVTRAPDASATPGAGALAQERRASGPGTILAIGVPGLAALATRARSQR